MIIIDDFIPKHYQEEIKQTILGRTFPWYFTNDITFGAKASSSAPAHAHLFRYNQKTCSDFYGLVAPLADVGAKAMDYKINDVVQCRSFLQTPLNDAFIKQEIDPLHIDLTYDHLVVLYYVLDSDGDTIIVDKQCQNNTEEYDCHAKDYKILQAVTPKQGRAVIFDGKYYHTAEQPRNGLRCIINFDII